MKFIVLYMLSLCLAVCHGLDAWQEGMLQMHNQARTTVASGNLCGQPSAKTMPMLTWDANLANAAKAWALRCRFEHDLTSGQGENLSFSTFVNPDLFTPWFDEHKQYRFGPIPRSSSVVTGHYTQIVWAKTTKLGCYKTRCQWLYSFGRYVQNADYLVCRYSPAGNMIGTTPYEQKNPARAC